MPITSRWDTDDKLTILAVFEGEYTWNDFFAAVREMHALMSTVTHRVDLILYHTVNTPPGNPLLYFRKAFETQPANAGQVIVVNIAINAVGKSFMKALSSVLQKIYPNKSQVLFENSLDDARRTLVKLREQAIK